MRAAFALLLGACHAHTAATFPGPLRPMLETHANAWEDTTWAAGLLDTLGPPSPRLALAPSVPRGTRSPGPPAALQLRIRDAASSLIDRGLPRGARDDCSGFVLAALDAAGVASSGGTRDLWARAEQLGVIHRRAPQPGDLAFFDATYDRDGNGRFDDPLTHVGIVVEVDRDGTVTVAHRASSAGLSLLRMNPQHPRDATGPDGQRYNDVLRGESPRAFAGELWRGYATIRPADVDGWAGAL